MLKSKKSCINQTLSKNNINKKHKDDIIDISIYDENKEFKDVFHPLLSDENPRPLFKSRNPRNKTPFIIPCHKTDFILNVKNKKKAINSLFNVNTNYQLRRTPPSKPMKRFIKGMKKIFFGPRGVLTCKMPILQAIYKEKYKEDFNSKIDIGELAYLDCQQKNCIINREVDVKKRYFQRSNNFSVDIKGLYLDKPLKLREKQKRNFKSINLESQKIFKTFSNVGVKNTKSSTEEGKNNKKVNKIPEHLKKNEKIPIRLNIPFHCGRMSYNENRFTCNTLFSKTFITCNDLKKAHKRINSELKSIDDNYSKLEGELCDIIDKLNISTKKTLKRVKNSKTNRKIEKDIEVILEKKFKNEKEQDERIKDLLNKNFIQNTEEDYKKAILRLSDEISLMSNENALQFAEKITQMYNKKTKEDNKKKKIYSLFPYDKKLRDKCLSNQVKYERIAFSLDKLKKRYNLE